MTIVLDELVSILTDFKTFFMGSAFVFYLLRNVLISLNNASCPGGDFPYESDGDARRLA